MSKRRSMSRSGSKRLFTNTAKHAHPLNVPHTPMRGGYRL